MSFFPQLVAGPIVRAAMFMPQLRVKRSLSMRRIKFLLMLFLAGFFKKAVISDSLSPTVDQLFAAPQMFDAQANVLGTVLYADPDLLRFFRLYRHGDRGSRHAGLPLSAEFRSTLSCHLGHGFLAPLASCPCRPGCATICTYRSAAIGMAPSRPTAICC